MVDIIVLSCSSYSCNGYILYQTTLFTIDYTLKCLNQTGLSVVNHEIDVLPLVPILFYSFTVVSCNFLPFSMQVKMVR